MRLKAFFAWRIAAIRRRVVRARAFEKLEWTLDSAIGFSCVAFFALVLANSEPGLVFAAAAVLIGASALYTLFALITQLLVYGEWGDHVYDKITKKSLSLEYQKSKSSTGSRRLRGKTPKR